MSVSHAPISFSYVLHFPENLHGFVFVKCDIPIKRKIVSKCVLNKFRWIVQWFWLGSKNYFYKKYLANNSWYHFNLFDNVSNSPRDKTGYFALLQASGFFGMTKFKKKTPYFQIEKCLYSTSEFSAGKLVLTGICAVW